MPSKKKLPVELITVQGELARRSFKAFVDLFWQVVEPSNPLQDNWHLDAICEHLEALPSVRNLLINIPPRHLKSTLCSVLYPAWIWVAKKASTKFLCTSYALQLSIRDSIRCRRLIESQLFQACYGDRFHLNSDENRKDRFSNDHTGYRLATSVESANVGEGADIILIDDPNNVNEVASQAERQKVLDWWSTVMATRLNDPNTGCRVVIQQRCHEEDLSGYIVANDKANNWCRLILPLQYEPGKHPRNKFGWIDKRTKPGELLSKRIPPEEIEFLRNSLGTAAFSAQFNQQPAPATGEHFSRDWFRYYDEQGTNYRLGDRLIDKKACWRLAVADLAISTKSSADFTVAGVFDVSPDADIILVHMARGRYDGPKVINLIKGIHESYRPAYIGIEDVAYQRLVIQQLRQAGYTVRALKPETDKLTRSIPLQVKLEAGQVWLPRGKAYCQDIELELMQFPNGAKDDICFVAGTMVETGDGSKPIETVRSGDKVLTRQGFHKVISAGPTANEADLLTLTLSDGTQLTGTANHPVLTDAHSYVNLGSLTPNERVMCLSRQSSTREPSTEDTPNLSARAIGFTFNSTVNPPSPRNTCTAASGKTPTDQSRPATTSTIRTETRRTTTLTTWNASRARSTGESTPSVATIQRRQSGETWTESAPSRSNGTVQKLGEHGTSSKPKRLGQSESRKPMSANTAENNMPASSAAVSGFAPRNAPKPHAGSQALTTRQGVANCAETNSGLVVTPKLGLVPAAVVALSAAGKGTVYNLKVEKVPEYFANGVLVHNCDTFSYAALEVNKRTRNRRTEEPPSVTQLTPEQAHWQMLWGDVAGD